MTTRGVRSHVGRRQSRTAVGFTLVELVVALSIFAVMSLLLVNSLQLATRTWDAVEQRTAVVNAEHVTLGFLQRQIELAQPMRISRKANEREIAFVGEAHALRFVAPLPGHLGAGGLYWFTLELVSGPEDKRLVLSYELFQREEWERFAPPKVEQIVLMEGLTDAEFAYWEPEQEERPARWTGAWEPQQRLPRLIRIRLADQSGAGGAWQELFIAPKLAPYQAEA